MRFFVLFFFIGVSSLLIFFFQSSEEEGGELNNVFVEFFNSSNFSLKEEEVMGVVVVNMSENVSKKNNDSNLESEGLEEFGLNVSKFFIFELKDELNVIELSLSDEKYDSYSDYLKEFEYYGDLPSDWEESFYEIFINEGDDDLLIKSVIEQIRGSALVLSDRDELEAVISFVQLIQYDYDKYFNLFSDVNYPYETVFGGKGVCSDKTILLVKLLQELGYEVVGFVFDNANHIAVGLKCDEGNFGTSYCFIESTSVSPIGFVPDSYGIYGGISLDKNPRVLRFSSGKSFDNVGVYKDEQVELILKYGEEYISSSFNVKRILRELNVLEGNLNRLESEYISLSCVGELSQDRADSCNELVDVFNSAVFEFNSKIEEYNVVIEKERESNLNEYNYRLGKGFDRIEQGDNNI